MEFSQQIFFLLTRSFLHLFISAGIYFLITTYLPISKTSFLLIILPAAVFLEYYQYIKNVSDSAGQLVILRDLLEILVIVCVLSIVYFFGGFSSQNLSVIAVALILFLLFVISALVEYHKPFGQHLAYKSFIDVVAYGLGPLLMYPLLLKVLKL